MEWIEKKSSELYVSSSGLSKSSDQFGYGYPFLSYKDVFNNFYVPEKLVTLVNSTEKDRIKCSVKKGDVFLTRTSETTDELGMSCVALHDYENATFNGFTKRLRPLTEEIAPIYAAYYFRSPYFRSQCISLASLITRASLNDGMIRRLKIRYPIRKDLQEKIGDVLYKYDTLIENNTKRIRLLEKMAENLYKEWFVRFRFPGHEKVEMVNGLPKGWKYYQIKELCDINRETIKSTNAPKEILYLDTGSVICGKISEIETIAFADAPSRARRIVKNNSIVYSTVRPNLRHYGILKNPPLNLLVSTGFAVLDCKEDIANIVYLALSHPSVYKYCSLIADCAVATYPSIKPKEIGSICIALPKLTICKKWNEKVETYYKMIDNLQHQNTLLARQRDLLLPRLMSGKLEVKAES